MPAKLRTCNHCHKRFRGKYCPECGQRVGIIPTSLEYLFATSLHAVDLERGLPITFIHLFTKPAEVSDQFLRGVTRKYTNPIQYLLVSLTVTFLFFFQKDNWLLYARSGLFIVILLLTNVMFSRRYTNFYGHLIIAMYQTGQISFLFLISALLGPYIDPYVLAPALLAVKYLLFIAYPLWSSVRMFHLKGQRILLFLLLIFVNVNIGILLWLEFIVQQKPLSSLLS
jgi:hypothetical protein